LENKVKKHSLFSQKGKRRGTKWGRKAIVEQLWAPLCKISAGNCEAIVQNIFEIFTKYPDATVQNIYRHAPKYLPQLSCIPHIEGITRATLRDLRRLALPSHGNYF